jgi:hypothetical protein
MPGAVLTGVSSLGDAFLNKILTNSQIHSFYDPGPSYRGCVVYAARTRLLLMSITTIMLYAFLLVAMLVGLLRYRRARSFRLWNMLNKQVECPHTET